MLERKLAEAAVAVVRVGGRQVPPRRAELAIAIVDELRIAIDVRTTKPMPSCVPVPRKFSSSSSKPRGVLAALASERNAGIERPDVLRRHFDVDDAVVKRHRPDLRIAQVARVAQDARRFFEQAGPVEVAALEEQLIFDGRLARGDVQPIARAATARCLRPPPRYRTDRARRNGSRRCARPAARAPRPTADPAARGASAFGARALTLGRTLALRQTAPSTGRPGRSLVRNERDLSALGA